MSRMSDEFSPSNDTFKDVRAHCECAGSEAMKIIKRSRMLEAVAAAETVEDLRLIVRDLVEKVMA